MTEQQSLFYESYFDAIEATIRALGGYKKVGALLRPNMESGADRWLRDCLNPDRREKLDIEELATLRRMGRDVGCHAITSYECSRAGYEPPVAMNNEEVARRLVDVLRQTQAANTAATAQLADLLKRFPNLLQAVA